ncbi:hypothetical protein KQX54_017441 [Cotesia glomerata]|uniref:Uncharacterized protein n=1 Tax=Cotesia glomerata TaxID=32391 RepID=A0AAV7I1N9_COTGL|nr:hypothetical protein KQX54_017441 [Cotesia glomerata]
MKTAPDNNHFVSKVILIFGVCGALRCDEISKLKVQDVEDREFSRTNHQSSRSTDPPPSTSTDPQPTKPYTLTSSSTNIIEAEVIIPMNDKTSPDDVETRAMDFSLTCKFITTHSNQREA